MNDKNNPADSPQDLDDIDDLDGLPTYHQTSTPFNSDAGEKRQRPPRTAAPPGPSIYEVAGRAAPQAIPPHPAEPEAPPAPVAPAAPTAAEVRSRPLLSDAPTSMHDPEPEFAETAVLGTVQPDVISAENSADTNLPLASGTALTEHTPGVTPGFAPSDPWADSFSEEDLDPANNPDLMPVARRGTLDSGLLIFRLILAGILIGDALRTFFLWGGSAGLVGLENSFSNYSQPHILAIIYPALQLFAGVFLALGLVHPLASAAAITAMGFFTTHIFSQGLLFTHHGLLVALLLAISIAITLTGPGRISFDRGRSWTERPLASSIIALLVGLIATGLIWWFLAGVMPFKI
ncbi:DoxX family protein [Corynebacterium caspium]|uniref:DoxX family protein n=1 Tax=Corynebacterium caspium TaxID=234828 RepID=UPI000378ECC4|nr:DoxX family protein [Corynebacterium caspium]WKD59420.1 hypothetical protein CCASP_05160 [Corynebacterium caspium DSM 44850]